MGVINLLDKNVAELVAAGEVIERPASIVKELLENSIDASSTAITIEIKHGGISYIRISDNGCGIAREDIPYAFLRHATSKIKVEDDLDSISTLGFRGEALASIAAVSRVEMISKRKEDQFATKIFMQAGEQLNIEEVGAPDGTTIIVSDLFYNVPARLKFLKKDVSEGNAIAGIVDKIALSHPEISFKLICDNKVRIHTPGSGDWISSIHSVFGREFTEALIPVNYTYNQISVNGYISNTRNSRSNRAMQHFFINERYVKSKTCMAAIEEAYKNSIMIGKFPFCVLNIDMPYNMVDVNVHPAKIEVRFVNERVVFDALYFAVKSTLTNDDILKKAVTDTPLTKNKNLLSTFKTEESQQIKLDESMRKENINTLNKVNTADEDRFLLQEKPVYNLNDGIKINLQNDTIKEEVKTELNESFNYITKESFEKKEEKPLYRIVDKVTVEDNIKEENIVIQKEQILQETDIPEFKIIGEVFKTYLLFETGESLFLLDKHAAHERIIFEKLKKTVSTKETQVLMKPVIINTSTEEYQAISSNIEIVNKLGFIFEEFGHNAFIIREVPLILSEYDIAEIFIDIASKIAENKRDILSDIFENLLHSIACRSAIKANDTTSIEELKELMKQVYANDEIRHCPHGRPVVIEITKTKIEKQFGRI